MLKTILKKKKKKKVVVVLLIGFCWLFFSVSGNAGMSREELKSIVNTEVIKYKTKKQERLKEKIDIIVENINFITVFQDVEQTTVVTIVASITSNLAIWANTVDELTRESLERKINEFKWSILVALNNKGEDETVTIPPALNELAQKYHKKNEELKKKEKELEERENKVKKKNRRNKSKRC